MGDARRETWGEVFPSVLMAAQAGAAWALRDLWQQLSPAVHAFLSRRGSQEPEDLTSEVFLTVFEQLEGFRGDEAQFRAFVFTVAYRRLVDELRRRARRGAHVEWDDGTDPRTSSSAEDEAVRQLGDAAARAMLDQLPIDQRNVMALRIFGDLTIEQVAVVIGKRPGAVKALQRRALASLRKKIDATRTPPGRPNDSQVK